MKPIGDALLRGRVSADVVRADIKAAVLHSVNERSNLMLRQYTVPSFLAEQTLSVLKGHQPAVPLIVVTRPSSESAVVSLFHEEAKVNATKAKLTLLPALTARVRRQQETTTEAALERANARLRRLSSHFVAAQERERTDIARDLHDGLGQLLTSIVMQLRAAEHHVEVEKIECCRAIALECAQQAIEQVKSLSFQLRPAHLELFGFVAGIKATLARQSDATGLQYVVIVHGTPPAAVHPSHGVALRILQEALTNVIRHASATHVFVRIKFRNNDHFTLTISDDGCGFDLKATLDGGISARNIGLHGMFERAELMGGLFRLRSKAGRGSVARLWM